MNNFYVYFHINPLKNKIFYVGKGTGKRAYTRNKRSTYWQRVANKYGYIVDVIQENLSEEEAFNLEKHYINFIGLKNLCNITEGGTGGDTISNHPNKEAIRIKNSLASKGENNTNFGSKYKLKEGYIDQQIESNSKKPLKVTDTITNEIKFYRNSKEAALDLGGKPSNLRTCKGHYLFLKRYKVEDVLTH